MTDAHVPSSPPRRGSWKRRVLLFLGALLVLLALAPFYLGPILRSYVESQLAERFDARARVRAVSFGWPCRLQVRGIELLDESNAPLVSLDELRASLELGPLVSGEIRADIELVYPELHVSRTAERWNFERALAKATAGEPDRAEPDGSGELPELRVHLRLSDGHVVIHGPGGETTLTNIALEVTVDGLARPAPFRLSLDVRGPGGPAGGLVLEGSLTAANEGRIEPTGFEGAASLALTTIDLAAFGPALGLLAPIDGLAGRLEGGAQLTLGSGLALEGKSDLVLRDFALRGPLGPPSPPIASLALRGEATQLGGGAGTQRLELTADSFLKLVYEGDSDLRPSGPGRVAGKLALEADVGPMAELARGWVPLVTGVQLQGRLIQTLDFEALLADQAPLSAQVRLKGAVEGLAARDAEGRTLDLAELRGIDVDLEATLDVATGTIVVPRLAFHAGPASCEGSLEALGPTPAEPEREPALRRCDLRFAADLERLRGTLEPLVALEGLRFGGQIEAQVSLLDEGQGLVLESRVGGRALELDSASLDELQGELHARRSLDGTLAGSGRLRFGAMGLAQEGTAPLALPGALLTLALHEDPAGIGEHTLVLELPDDALKLELRVRSERRAEGELDLTGTLASEGEVARLSRLAAPFLPVQSELGGRLLAKGELRGGVRLGALASAGGALEVELVGLSARDATGAALPLEALAHTKLSLAGEYDPGQDRAELGSLVVEAGGLRLQGSGRATGLSNPVPELEGAHLEFEADLQRLGPELARVLDLAGWSVDGRPLTMAADLSTQDQRIEARGQLSCEALRIARPEGPPLEQRELGLAFDLGYDAALGSLHLRRATARSQTATLKLEGTLNEVLDPTRTRGAMTLEFAGELARILGDLGLEEANSGRQTSGALRGRVALKGDSGAFEVTGRTTIEPFRLELAPAAEGQKPFLLEEPSIVLEYQARVTLPALDADLGKLTLTSDLARGGAQGRIENLRGLGSEEVRFAGLTGQFAYVPDRLGLVLAPLLPGKLSGSEEQLVTFTLDGRARDFGLAELLAGSQARVDLGIGRFERPEIQLGGALVLEAKDEKLLLRGDLSANGGTLQLDGTLDAGGHDSESPASEPGKGPPPRSRLKVTAKELRANSGLAPLLALVHPAFGTAQLAQGSLDGLIELDLDLTYDGPLTLDQLEAGWETLPKTPMNGSGRFVLREAGLKGSPLLGALAQFGLDATKSLDVRPIEFTIQKGRVTYARPWTWTLAGTETTFTGSVGLDQSLDLAWNVPVSEALVERWSFLAALKGETLAVPLRGTTMKPRLEADDLLKDLAAKAAKKELEGRLLGRGGGADDPATLLGQADRLWDQGKKTEAAAIYARLREDFRLSLTYALNKDRIKDRSKYEAPK